MAETLLIFFIGMVFGYVLGHFAGVAAERGQERGSWFVNGFTSD